MKNVFIDSNVWLDLYHFSNDDLEQFRKLKDLLNNDVAIFFNEQVQDEIGRNRENKIKDAYAQFKGISIKIPNLCKGYSEYETLVEMKKNFEQVHRDLCEKVNEHIATESLHADQAIKEILNLVEIHDIEPYLDKARLRMDRGNPPGKNRSYGDAINWEFLLDKVPNDEDFFLISADRDYRSANDSEAIDPFLKNEWQARKNGRLFFYTGLSVFFARHLKDIELVAEVEKNELINELENSGSFANTHHVIGKLSFYSSFTDEQTKRLVSVAETNSQVGSILGDPDLRSFYRTLLEGKVKRYENDGFVWLLSRLGFVDTPNLF